MNAKLAATWVPTMVLTPLTRADPLTLQLYCTPYLRSVEYHHVDGYRKALEVHIAHTSKMGVRPFSVGHEH